MESKDNPNGINRRAFFKKAIQKTLPILGMLAIPALPSFAEPSQTKAPDYCPGSCTDFVSIRAQVAARENAKEAVKAIVREVAKHHAPQHANSNVQVLVVKHVQVGVDKYVAEIVQLHVKGGVNPYAKMTAQWAVKDSVPMGVPAVARVVVPAHAVEIVEMVVVVVAMVLQGYSK